MLIIHFSECPACTFINCRVLIILLTVYYAVYRYKFNIYLNLLSRIFCSFDTALIFFACFCVVRFCACDSAHILQLFSVEKGENRIV